MVHVVATEVKHEVSWNQLELGEYGLVTDARACPAVRKGDVILKLPDDDDGDDQCAVLRSGETAFSDFQVRRLVTGDKVEVTF